MEPNNSQGSGFNISEFFTKLRNNPILALKVGMAVVVGLFVLVFVLTLVCSMFGPITQRLPGIYNSIAPTMQGSIGYGGGMGGGAVEYDMAVASDYYDGGYGSAKGYALAPSMPELSARNVASSITMPYPPYPQPGTPGNDAEEFEVTNYNASIETRRLSETCDSIAGLKERKDVIFENSNTSDHNCNFTFKVEHKSVDEVLVFIKGLDPKNLAENTYTIKREINDYTSEIEVLEKKRASIDETLKSAIAAYNEVTALATRSQNADALASIINSKINIIERMTQERININEQIDRYTRSKSEQLDRLDYTYFYVNVFENKFVDGEQIVDSWKQAVQNFVYQLNRFIQGLTLNFLLLLLIVAQWLLYGVIALFIIKYGWKFVRYIWLR